MKMEDLVKTDWAREFKEDSPVSYGHALRLAGQSNLEVEIQEARSVMHEPGFAVIAADEEPEFWMSHKPTREAAQKLCDVMGWRVV